MTRDEFFDRALLAYATVRDVHGYLLSDDVIALYADALLAHRAHANVIAYLPPPYNAGGKEAVRLFEQEFQAFGKVLGT